MSCFDKLKKSISIDGVKLPKSPSLLAGVKDLLSFKGPGEAIERAEGLIKSNIKNLASAFSPAGIANKVEDTVNGLTSEIDSRVNAAIEGVTNLKSRLQSLVQTPSKIMDIISGKIDGIGDLKAMASEVTGEDCAKAAVFGSSQVLSKVDESIKSDVAKLTSKERKLLKTNPDSAEAKALKQRMSDNAAGSTKSDALSYSAPTRPDSTVNGEPSVQSGTAQPNLPTQPVTQNVDQFNIFNSMMTTPQAGWPANHGDKDNRYTWSKYKPYIQPHIDKFFSGYSSGDKPKPVDQAQPDTITRHDDSPFVSPVTPNRSQIYTMKDVHTLWDGLPEDAGDGNRTFSLLMYSYITGVSTSGDNVHTTVQFSVLIKYHSKETIEAGVLYENNSIGTNAAGDVEQAHGAAMNKLKTNFDVNVGSQTLIFNNFYEAEV